METFKFFWVGDGVAIGVRMRLHEKAREDAGFVDALEQALKALLGRSLDFASERGLRVLPAVVADEPVALKTRGIAWTYHFVELGRDRILLFDEDNGGAEELTLREARVLPHTLCVDTVAPSAQRSVSDMMRTAPRK